MSLISCWAPGSRGVSRGLKGQNCIYWRLVLKTTSVGNKILNCVSWLWSHWRFFFFKCICVLFSCAELIIFIWCGKEYLGRFFYKTVAALLVHMDWKIWLSCSPGQNSENSPEFHTRSTITCSFYSLCRQTPHQENICLGRDLLGHWVHFPAIISNHIIWALSLTDQTPF